MTPILILDQTQEKVKSEVYGSIVLQVESNKIIEPNWLQVQEFKIRTLSGETFVPKVHDWEVEDCVEIDGKWYGKIELMVSLVIQVNEEDALYAAHCSISELNALIRQVVINGEALKVNDFSIDWESVYTE